MVREVASKTSDAAGDGTTTATVLAHAIVREGAKAVAAGMNPMDLRRGVEMAVATVIEDLKKRTKKIKSSDEIAQATFWGRQMSRLLFGTGGARRNRTDDLLNAIQA